MIASLMAPHPWSKRHGSKRANAQQTQRRPSSSRFRKGFWLFKGAHAAYSRGAALHLGRTRIVAAGVSASGYSAASRAAPPDGDTQQRVGQVLLSISGLFRARPSAQARGPSPHTLPTSSRHIPNAPTPVAYASDSWSAAVAFRKKYEIPTILFSSGDVARRRWPGLLLKMRGHFLPELRSFLPELLAAETRRRAPPRGVRCAFRRSRPGIPSEGGRLYRLKPAGHSDDAGHLVGRVLASASASGQLAASPSSF